MNNIADDIHDAYEEGYEYGVEQSSEILKAAERDIAALLWLNGNCEYCAYGKCEEYSGAGRWECSRPKGASDCKPIWRYAQREDKPWENG